MADALSALFLLLAILLAGGYGPQTVQAASAPLQSPTDLGTGGHRSAPFISKQQLLASETRDTKVAPWDDGKPKTFLASARFELPAPLAGTGHAPQVAATSASPPASPFDARAPPVQS